MGCFDFSCLWSPLSKTKALFISSLGSVSDLTLGCIVKSAGIAQRLEGWDFSLKVITFFSSEPPKKSLVPQKTIFFISSFQSNPSTQPSRWVQSTYSTERAAWAVVKVEGRTWAWAWFSVQHGCAGVNGHGAREFDCGPSPISFTVRR